MPSAVTHIQSVAPMRFYSSFDNRPQTILLRSKHRFASKLPVRVRVLPCPPARMRTFFPEPTPSEKLPE